MRMERRGSVRKVLPGKMTLDSSVSMITQHSRDPTHYGPQQMSEQYKINSGVAANIVKYYGIFNMMETETREHEHDQPHDPLKAGQLRIDQSITKSDVSTFQGLTGLTQESLVWRRLPVG